MLLLLLTSALLTIADPAGDALGDGGYILPSQPGVTADALDIRSFSAVPDGEGMRFTVSFGQMGNPWNAPSGFSAGVTDIFIKAGPGGRVELADTGLRARSGGWQYHLRVTGYGSTLEQSVDGGNQEGVQPLAAPVVGIDGTELVIDSAVPAGRYAYWVTSSVYTPLSADGVLRPTGSTGPGSLQTGRADAPTPVDVLAPAEDTRAFTDSTLAPVGKTRDQTSVILAGLGALGLLLTVGATVFARRRA
ncbi:glucodextranase DOMON-like domain-containing protein [Deinococcus arenicola]|uniref:Regulator n=1 Tax=Deinococcus arenicola TaxID=2994950 RepID=A0ABU4DWD8_9DEIO|nr:glucodextranase DOMON-like domain-containing protein [Deinococcus sp. ZS9-10]MDV6375979.1 regulator [Deinococcus sp. ZS9-10]